MTDETPWHDPTEANIRQNRTRLLASMSATISAGIWAGSISTPHGHKPHHDADRESVARMAVDLAERILKRIEEGS